MDRIAIRNKKGKRVMDCIIRDDGKKELEIKFSPEKKLSIDYKDVVKQIEEFKK